ncbi:THUMP domain-containing protein 3-like isoform X2 [Hyalella azteca]|nr:THUMP domain-containing protein 3-like isoform X2 [Hyalella azteca]
MRAWQHVFEPLESDPFACDMPLCQAYQEPNPVLDLRLLKKGSPVALNLPDNIRQLREQHAQAYINDKTKCKKDAGLAEKTPPEDIEVQVTSSDCSSTVASASNKLSSGFGDESLINSLDGCKIVGHNSTTMLNSEDQLQCSTKTPGTIDTDSNGANAVLTNTTDDDHFRTHGHQSLKQAGQSSVEGNSHPNSFMTDAEVTSPPPRTTSRDNSSGPSFRVCCNRSGTEHVFGSPEAARQLGAALNDRFRWPVKLKDFLVEVILNIADNFVYVCLALTREPLYRRNLVCFGPTNLRATLCYALLHLAAPQPGDLVLDHMCGGASITIEGALCFPACYHVGGELHSKAVDRAATNLQHAELTRGVALPAGLLRWDATKIPFRDSCADVIVSDLPFGKRSGKKADNRSLYLLALQETARVTRPGTGRAVLLTHDRNSLIKNLAHVREYWRNPSVRTINIGGLHAGVFFLLRTAALYKKPSTLPRCYHSLGHGS